MGVRSPGMMKLHGFHISRDKKILAYVKSL